MAIPFNLLLKKNQKEKKLNFWWFERIKLKDKLFKIENLNSILLHELTNFFIIIEFTIKIAKEKEKKLIGCILAEQNDKIKKKFTISNWFFAFDEKSFLEEH